MGEIVGNSSQDGAKRSGLFIDLFGNVFSSASI